MRSVVALAVVGIGTILALPVIAKKAAVHAFASIAAPAMGHGVMPKVAVANAVRRYALPTDPSIAPEAAGRAYHSLILWNDSGRPAALHSAPDSGANQWFQAEGTDSLGPLPPTEWCSELMRRAGHDLSAEQVKLLRDVTARPRDTLFRTFAQAPHADILGTRWTFQGLDEHAVFYLLLPLPRTSPFRSAVRVWCGRAALELHEGRPAQADSTLREALSASLLLMDEAPTGLELLVGAAMAKSVALNLATLYELTGRTSDAASIRGAIDRALPVQLPGKLGQKDLDGWDVIDALPAATQRGDIPQALKWEWLYTAQAVKLQQYCVGDDELGADYARWREGVRSGFMRRPSDGMFFDWITQKPARRGAECYRPGVATDDR